jgi:6-phospho-3-hexuloisomerase
VADFTTTAATVVREVQACLTRVDPAAVAALEAAVAEAPRVFLGGAGRSGLAMRALAMRLMHLGLSVHVLGEITTPAIAPGDLLLIGSGSGRTPSLVAAATKAAELGAQVALITIASASPIGQLAGTVVVIPAPSPKAAPTAGVQPSMQPMGALFEQCLWLLGDTLVLALMARTGQTSDAMFARHANLE